MSSILTNTPIPEWQHLNGGPSAIKPYGYSLGYNPQDSKWNESLVDLQSLGLLTKSWYAVTDGTNPPYNQKISGAISTVFMRKTPGEMCLAADELVKELGLRLLFVDGFRSQETQNGLWRFFRDKIKARNPKLSNEEIDKETLVYVSPGEIEEGKPETWFVHATGGSIDVLLYDPITQEILNCGVGFDDDTPMVFTDHFEKLLKKGEISPDSDSLVNRRIIHNAMITAGFTNYPYEYFHYDFGTILYSARMKLQKPDLKIQAFYGLAPSPSFK